MKYVLFWALIFLRINGYSQTVNQGGKRIYIPKDLRDMNMEDSNSQWSYHRMVCSENFVVFWEREFGADLSSPPLLEGHDMKVDLSNLLERLETFYHYYRDTLKFSLSGSRCDSCRMMVMLNYSLEGTAYGGDYDGQIGALWVAPNRIQDKKLNCIAHELGHSFQAQITCDGQGNAWGGSGFFEMTSQWMLWQVNPAWIVDEQYHWDAFRNLTHKAFLHLDNIYHSPYILEYWSEKRGLPFIAEMFRKGKIGEDPVMTYKELTGETQEQFCDEMFEASCYIVNMDYPRASEVSCNCTKQFPNPLLKSNKGWSKVDVAYCPESYGFNVIELKIPTAGQKVWVGFKGDTTICGVGWRYGFVALTVEGKNIYGKISKEHVAKVSFVAPKGETLSRLCFVVMGAPMQHQINPQPDSADTYMKFPYSIKINQ